VLEFLDTDLEIIIRDRSLVFLPADIKSWMAMTFRGLEFCHRNWILHRVRSAVSCRSPSNLISFQIGLETQQLAHRFRWSTQDRRFRPGKGLCRPRVQDDMSGYHSVRPCLSSPGPL